MYPTPVTVEYMRVATEVGSKGSFTFTSAEGVKHTFSSVNAAVDVY
jgi:hypothetical protein